MNDSTLQDKEYVAVLATEFEKHRHPVQADAMARYMKDRFVYYGIKAPLRREILRKHINTYGLPKDWRKTLQLCWDWEEREMQYVGMELAYRCRKKMTAADIELFERITIEKSWWDTVDFIAANLIGHYFFTFPDKIEAVTNRWINSENMWLIRSCILFQLKYKDFTNFRLLQKFIHQHKRSSEFFIQKAIGWALRQYARTEAFQVRAFVAETELKPLSRREALKHFS